MSVRPQALTSWPMLFGKHNTDQGYTLCDVPDTSIFYMWASHMSDFSYIKEGNRCMMMSSSVTCIMQYIQQHGCIS